MARALIAILVLTGASAQAQSSKPQSSNSNNSNGTVSKGPLQGFTGETCALARRCAKCSKT
jgi:hypothetical protein